MGLNRENEEEKRHVPLVIGLLSLLVMCWSDLALFWDLGFCIKSFLGMQRPKWEINPDFQTL